MIINTVDMGPENPLKTTQDNSGPIIGYGATAVPRPKTIPTTVTKVTIRDEIKWRVRYQEHGRVRRAHFNARDQADSFAAKIRGDAVSARQELNMLPQAEQQQLMMLRNECTTRGIPLMNLFAMVQEVKSGPVNAPAIEDVWKELEGVMTKAGRDPVYIKCFGYLLIEFYEGRERMAVDKFTVVDVREFMDKKSKRYHATIRARLSTFFNFAVRGRDGVGYRTDNPCSMLEKQRREYVEPEIFTIKEAKICLAWLKSNPRLLGWFALSSFAGLRPEEATQMVWSDIHFDEKWVYVPAKISKNRKARTVYPHSIAFQWLRIAKRLGAELPVCVSTYRRNLKLMRELLGWAEWKQDVTRHSAASYWIWELGSFAEVAIQLGNSEKVLRSKYVKPITKEQAKQYWALSPAACKTESQKEAARLRKEKAILNAADKADQSN